MTENESLFDAASQMSKHDYIQTKGTASPAR
jgi:hypothetical protein